MYKNLPSFYVGVPAGAPKSFHLPSTHVKQSETNADVHVLQLGSHAVQTPPAPNGLEVDGQTITH